MTSLTRNVDLHASWIVAEDATTPPEVLTPPATDKTKVLSPNPTAPVSPEQKSLLQRIWSAITSALGKLIDWISSGCRRVISMLPTSSASRQPAGVSSS